jgi:hypothetical protein
MASAAQIEANRSNAKRSTGPKSASAKKRVSMNAIKHGLFALTIVPVSSQADSGQEGEWIRRWERTVQPQNDIEWNLVRQGARLSLEIELGKRKEKELLEAWRHAQFREISRRLLYIAGAEEVKVSRMPPWTDDPGRFVSQLEVSAEGCRWLLERWQEYRNLLDLELMWYVPEMLRFIRLQGKDVVESTYDRQLNAIFVAWDVLDPEYAGIQWGSFQKIKPITDPAFNHRLRWREVTDRPADLDAAWAVLSGIVNQHVVRLQELLAANEAREAAGDTDWAPRAGLDCSAAFERLRRSQSARHRELMKTIAELRKIGKEGFGTIVEEAEEVASEEGVANGDGVASGEWRVASENGVASGQWSVASESGEGRETAPDLNQSSSVGQDSNLVHDDSSNDKIGILSPEETHAAGQIGQGLPGDVVTPEKATIKANPRAKQCAGQRAQGPRQAGAKKAREQSQLAREDLYTMPGSLDGPMDRQRKSNGDAPVSHVPDSGWPTPKRGLFTPPSDPVSRNP